MCAKIIEVDCCPSSNAEVHKFPEFIETKTEFLLSVKHQKNGRGMGTNLWFASPGKNITASLVKFPTFLKPDKQFYLSMAVSLGIYDLLSEIGLKIKIKWPNDIWIDQKKICGILIENEISTEGILMSKIGVGLNVNETDFPDDIPNPVSLTQISDNIFSVKELTYQLSVCVDRYYNELKNNEIKQLKKKYLSALLGYKKYLDYTDADGKFTAKIIDVNEFGYLVLVDKNGKERTYEMKQVQMVF